MNRFTIRLPNSPEKGERERERERETNTNKETEGKMTYTPVTIVLDKFMSGGVSSRMHVLHVLPPDPPRLLTHGLSHSWTVPQVEEVGV